MSHYFGAHTIGTGGPHMAAARAGAAGMRALQIFSGMPQFYNEKASVKPEKAARFTAALAAAGIEKRHCIVHAAYVLNTASPEPEKYERAKLGLAKELERTTTYGILGFCFHPGSAGQSDPAGAVERVGDAMAFALAQVPDSSRILIENTAGAGRTMGRTPQEIAGMLARIPAESRARAGYGLDTCHLFASGHDFHSAPGKATELLDRFCDVIGEAPSFLHLNDSEGDFASNKDRHALIGEGKIGVDAFRWLLQDRRTQEIPLILETPQENPDIAEGDESADPWDVRMIALLQSLVA